MENKPVHVLCDLFTNRILHITDDLELINTIAKIPETQVLYYVVTDCTPGYRNLNFLPDGAFHLYVLNFMTDTVTFDNKISNEQQLYFTSIAAKIEALTVILRSIKSMRAEFERTPTQNYIHELKYQQAKAGSGDFVSDWANIKGYTIEEAAKDIIINHEFQVNHLLKTEHLRLEYTNKILKETVPQKMWDLVKEFRLTSFGNQKI